MADFVAGRFDVAVTGRPPDGIEVESALIGDHPHVLIAPVDHPLARRRAIDPKLIANETILVREPGSGTRQLTERFLARAGVKPKIGMEIGSNETIKQAVIAGLGIAFISAHTIEAEIEDGRLAMLDVVGLPEMRKWYVVRPAAKRLMPAAAALRNFLVSEGHASLPKIATPKRRRKART